MTYAEYEQKVRELVNDTDELAYRFESAQIQGFVRDAVRRLRHMNPSERYGENGLLDAAVPDPGGYGGDVRAEPRHEEAVVKYAAHLVYQLDMSDTVNLQISEALRVRAEELMRT